MNTEIQIALLGIWGTLGGTILGWVLNSLSQKVSYISIYHHGKNHLNIIIKDV